jgi:hypothetical protein
MEWKKSDDQKRGIKIIDRVTYKLETEEEDGIG